MYLEKLDVKNVNAEIIKAKNKESITPFFLSFLISRMNSAPNKKETHALLLKVHNKPSRPNKAHTL